MTGWVERLNRAVLRRISSRSPVLVTDLHVRVGARTYRFFELQRVVAFRQPSWVGDALAVALEFEDGAAVVVTEQDRGWPQLLTALDADSRTEMVSAEWSMRLVGGDAETRLEVLRRER